MPVLVPKIAERILEYITSPTVREAAGVQASNPYVFASNSK